LQHALHVLLHAGDVHVQNVHGAHLHAGFLLNNALQLHDDVRQLSLNDVLLFCDGLRVLLT